MAPCFHGRRTPVFGLLLLLAALPLTAAASPTLALAPRQPVPVAAGRFEPITLHMAAPPLREMWPSWPLLLLALVIIVLGIYRWRLASIEGRNRQLAMEVSERTLTIAGQTADLEALYQADEELERHVQLDQVLQALVDIAVDRLHADKSAVLAWDDRHARLIMRVARNFSAQAIERLSFAPGEGFVGQVLATGEPVMVEDAAADLGRVSERAEVVEAVLGEGIRSFMHIPIRLTAEPARSETGQSGSEVFGVFNVCYDEPRAFGDREQRLFTALAQRAALAVQNARLYENSQRQIAQLTALQETNRALASTLDRDALLKLIMAQATSLLHADGGLINLVDWDAQEDEVVACSGSAARFLSVRTALDAGLSGWVALHNQPIISNRLDEDDRVAPGTLLWLDQARVQSAALAPLTIKDGVVGTLALIKEAGKGGFDQGDLDLLVAFADQAAIAIENARLYEEAQQMAASQERSRLARDLHDAVTQTLFSASLIAEVLPALWEGDQVEAVWSSGGIHAAAGDLGGPVKTR